MAHEAAKRGQRPCVKERMASARLKGTRLGFLPERPLLARVAELCPSHRQGFAALRAIGGDRPAVSSEFGLQPPFGTGSAFSWAQTILALGCSLI